MSIYSDRHLFIKGELTVHPQSRFWSIRHAYIFIDRVPIIVIY